MFENLESLATAVAILGGLISATIVLLGIYREWIWVKREKAEALLIKLVDEIGEQVIEIEEEFGWNMVHDKSSYQDIAQTLNGDRLKLFDRNMRRLLQKLETMAIRIKHELLDEGMFRDYFKSIAMQAVLKNQPFFTKERKNRSEEAIFRELELMVGRRKKPDRRFLFSKDR